MWAAASSICIFLETLAIDNLLSITDLYTHLILNERQFVIKHDSPFHLSLFKLTIILPYINNGKIYYVPVKTQITKELFEFPGIYPDEADFWHGRYLSGNDHFFEVFLNPRRVKSSIILYIHLYSYN